MTAATIATKLSGVWIPVWRSSQTKGKTMSKSITRRAALTGTAAGAAAIVAGAAPALAVEDQDRAEWLALWRGFIDKEALAMQAEDAAWEGPAAKAAEVAAWDARLAAEAAIDDRPATTMAGIAIKLALWVRLEGSSEKLGATLDDAPVEHTGAVAAYRDAARLAGIPEDLYAEGLL